MYKKVIISKEGNNPMDVYYEVGQEIESDNYEGLLNKFTPNFYFSLADKMIQDFPLGIVPSFKKSELFTNEDLEDIVRPFKKEYMIRKPIKKKPNAYFKHMTRRRKLNIKQGKKKRNTPPKKNKTQKAKMKVNKKVNNKK